MRALWVWVFALSLLSPPSAASAESAQDPSDQFVVATRNVPPFAILTKDGWSGIAIELWQRIAEGLQIPFELREMGLNEMLQAIETGNADAAAAALTITSERETKFDFSHPFHTSGLGIAVHQRPGGGWLVLLERVFSGQFLKALIPLLALLTLIGVLVWLAERRRNPQFQDDPLRGIGSGLWWSAVTMTTVGYGDKAPRTLPGRLVAMVWMFASVIIVSGLTGAIASALTVSSLDQSITGVNDLYRARVITLTGSTSEIFLQKRLIRSKPAQTLSDALDTLQQGGADAVVYDAPILQYLVAEQHPDSLRVLPQILQRQDYGIALPAGSPLREEVNRALLEIIRSEEWQRLLDQYLGRAPR